MDDSETTAEKSAHAATNFHDDGLDATPQETSTCNNNNEEKTNKETFVIPSVSIENAHSQESLFLSVIQENEEIDHYGSNRAKNGVSGLVDQCDSSLVKIDVFKRPLAPIETKKHPFNHRLSVPSILEPDSQRMCRSSSFQNINSSVEQGTAGDDFDDDEEFEEENLNKNKANLSTIDGNSDLKKRRLNSRHRKASLSAMFLPVLSSTAALGTSEFYVEVPKVGRKNSRRESTPDENYLAKNDQLSVVAFNQKVKRPLSINFAASSSMLNVSQSFDEKNMSASTPSVKELCDQAANIAANDENNSKNADPASFENKKDESPPAKPKDAIVDNSVIVRTKKTSQNSRGPSLYIPSITPRLPLKGFLPGSMRRLNEKLNDLNHNNNSFKPKDKERRSFFKHKSKSKELRQHHSWSNPNFKANLCDLCAKKPSSNQELLHCSDCGINVHPSCKDQAEKFGCPKSERSSLKNSRDETDQKNGKIASNEEPVHVLVRRKTIDEENCDTKSDNDNVIIRTSSLSFNNNNTNNRGSMSSLIKNHPLSVVYPNGFYAATSPDALWEELNLWAEEPEAWSAGMGKLEKKRLTSKEIKRQDIMHELYITEKHHCQILVVLKHTYFDTLINQNIIPAEEVDKLLPKLDHLLNLHQNFLRNLKNRKDECVIVETIHDVIHEQFTNDNAKLLIEAYTQFCAQKDLTDRMFQKFLQNNLHYQNFIKHLSSIPFYKSRTLRDCLLLVTQRLSKYHTFVENLRKNTPDDYSDKEHMQIAEKVVKDVIAAVDRGIERIQLDRFSKEIAQNTDSRSTSIFNNATFTAKNLLLPERILLYYCRVHWQNAKRMPADVLMLLYTDLVAFLMQNGAGGPYSFYSQDKKPSVISLQKMIVRDKAGRLGTDGIYLIATQPKPEMYEIKCRTKKETHVLAARIQSAIDKYPTQKLVPSPVEERAPEIVPKTVALLNDGDLEELEALFAKFIPTNDKLKSYFDDLFIVYEEIREFLTEMMSRSGTDAEKEQVARIFNDHMTSYLDSIKPQVIVRRLLTDNNVNISVTKRQLINDFLNVGDTDDTNNNSNNNGSYNDETDLHSQTSSSAPIFDDTSSTSTVAPSETSTMSSSNNAVSRSNTFHGRVRNSIRRSLRKYPTICGIPEVDVKTPGVIGDVEIVESSCESINKTVSITDSGHASEQNFSKNFLPNQFMVKSKLEMLALRQLNANLETEVALLKEECKHHRENLQNVQIQQQKKLTTTSTAVVSHSRQSSADSTHQTLEELRRLHANLDEKKQNFLRMVDEKEREFKNREAILAEKEAKLSLEDQELRSRWEQLYKAWDQKRFGSPSSTLLEASPPPPSPSSSPFRRSNSILMSRNFVRHSLSSGDVLSNVSGKNNSPPASSSAPRIQRPPQLPSPVDEDPPSPFPPPPLIFDESSKLPTPVSGFARFYPLGRSSLKAKKWHSTSKLTRNPSSVSSLGGGAASQQLLPSKLESSSNVGSSSRKK